MTAHDIAEIEVAVSAIPEGGSIPIWKRVMLELLTLAKQALTQDEELEGLRKECRRQGRAEALSILIREDAEGFESNYMLTHPLADTGDFTTGWDWGKLEVLFGSALTESLVEVAESGMYQAKGELLEEQEKAESLKAEFQASQAKAKMLYDGLLEINDWAIGGKELELVQRLLSTPPPLVVPLAELEAHELKEETEMARNLNTLIEQREELLQSNAAMRGALEIYADEGDDEGPWILEGAEWRWKSTAEFPNPQDIAKKTLSLPTPARVEEGAKFNLSKEKCMELAALEGDYEVIVGGGLAKPVTGEMVPITFYELRFYMFSNFSAFAVKFEGRLWPTSEHAYQGMKFEDFETQELIRSQTSAHVAMKLAQLKSNDYRENWAETKTEWMFKICHAKLLQHPYIQKKLMETDNRELVESSPVDSFWGWGPNKDGLNHLGKIWMALRDGMSIEAYTATTEPKEGQS